MKTKVSKESGITLGTFHDFIFFLNFFNESLGIEYQRTISLVLSYLKLEIFCWCSTENELFLKHTETLLIIFYEKLVKDPIKEVQKMAYPYTSEEEELFSSAKMNIRDLIINRGFDVPDEFIKNENPKSSEGELRSLK
ncbi:hypothetical protein Avbf_07309 [Armadillidium vulgare]|nr:hypothetical protein Avbf_07309 [Armadillidium vulgare]